MEIVRDTLRYLKTTIEDNQKEFIEQITQKEADNRSAEAKKKQERLKVCRKRMEAIKDKRHQQYILRKQKGLQQRWEKAYEPRRKERIAQLKAENPNTYGIPAEEYDQENYSRMSVVLANSVVPDF